MLEIRKVLDYEKELKRQNKTITELLITDNEELLITESIVQVFDGVLVDNYKDLNDVFFNHLHSLIKVAYKKYKEEYNDGLTLEQMTLTIACLINKTLGKIFRMKLLIFIENIGIDFIIMQAKEDLEKELTYMEKGTKNAK